MIKQDKTFFRHGNCFEFSASSNCATKRRRNFKITGKSFERGAISIGYIQVRSFTIIERIHIPACLVWILCNGGLYFVVSFYQNQQQMRSKNKPNLAFLRLIPQQKRRAEKVCASQIVKQCYRVLVLAFSVHFWCCSRGKNFSGRKILSKLCKKSALMISIFNAKTFHKNALKYAEMHFTFVRNPLRSTKLWKIWAHC